MRVVLLGASGAHALPHRRRNTVTCCRLWPAQVDSQRFTAHLRCCPKLSCCLLTAGLRVAPWARLLTTRGRWTGESAPSRRRGRGVRPTASPVMRATLCRPWQPALGRVPPPPSSSATQRGPAPPTEASSRWRIPSAYTYSRTRVRRPRGRGGVRVPVRRRPCAPALSYLWVCVCSEPRVQSALWSAVVVFCPSVAWFVRNVHTYAACCVSFDAVWYCAVWLLGLRLCCCHLGTSPSGGSGLGWPRLPALELSDAVDEVCLGIPTIMIASLRTRRLGKPRPSW